MALLPQDKRAAYFGLILGVAALLIILTGMVYLTVALHGGGAEAAHVSH